MRPALAILTTHFGTSFSGGSTATCEIFSRLENDFSSIYVIANEVGEHPFSNIIWLPYRTTWGAVRQIRALDAESTVFYGDFYNAFLFTLLNKPFFFTYHDNWPELKLLGWRNRLKNFFYWPLYRRVFKRARHVVTVSERKAHQLKKFTSNVSLIRNGFDTATKTGPRLIRKNIIMAGNIDTRKYEKAVHLFNQLPIDMKFEIHIYGHPYDQALAETLESFPFVKLKGHQPNLPYSDYALLLHTSLMENLSIVWCESLYQQTKVLTFNVGAAEEVINGDSGWCVAAYDIAAMKDQLLEHMQHPRSIKQIPPLLNQFNWQIASEQYRSLLLPESTIDA